MIRSESCTAKSNITRRLFNRQKEKKDFLMIETVPDGAMGEHLAFGWRPGLSSRVSDITEGAAAPSSSWLQTTRGSDFYFVVIRC